jgi:hypothetical protein
MGVGFTSQNGKEAPDLAMWTEPKTKCRTGAEKQNDFFLQGETLLHAKGRGERGGYGLLNVSLISWANPRFFCDYCSEFQSDKKSDELRLTAEMKSYSIGGKYVALAVGRFGEFSRDVVKLRDYISRQRAYAHNEHFNSSVNMAMSTFKLSFTPRWALMAARD